MLSRVYRLRQKNDIERVLKKGKRFTDPFFQVIIFKNGLSVNRFCVIISKKTEKRAHSRNRLKRQITEILRRNRTMVPEGYDVVILVFSPASGESSQVFFEHLAAIFRERFPPRR